MGKLPEFQEFPGRHFGSPCISGTKRRMQSEGKNKLTEFQNFLAQGLKESGIDYSDDILVKCQKFYDSYFYGIKKLI